MGLWGLYGYRTRGNFDDGKMLWFLGLGVGELPQYPMFVTWGIGFWVVAITVRHRVSF